MIKMQLIGTIGRDAESKAIGSNTVINFSVAHSEKGKDAQGNQTEKTIWVDCAKWGEKTGILPYLKKGTKVYVEGLPDVRSYTSKDGEAKASITLRVVSIELLSKAADSNQDSQNRIPAPSELTNEELDSQLPF